MSLSFVNKYNLRLEVLEKQFDFLQNIKIHDLYLLFLREKRSWKLFHKFKNPSFFFSALNALKVHLFLRVFVLKLSIIILKCLFILIEEQEMIIHSGNKFTTDPFCRNSPFISKYFEGFQH